MAARLTRRQFFPASLASLAALAGCKSTSTIFGYNLGADALYDTNIESVYVPMFANRAFQTTPYRGMEARITQAVVREIVSKTPYKIISDPDRADTELKGYVVSIGKTLVNRNQQNTLREGEVVVTVNVIWIDLRDGRILSAPKKKFNPATGVPVPNTNVTPIPFDPEVPLPPVVSDPQAAVGTMIVGVGRLIPELGESTSSGEQRAIDTIATQVVSMMEKQW